MVEVHLSDEEKIHVLFLAAGFFLVALLVSICLAVSYCPLNKWLIERHARRKRQRQQEQHQSVQISSRSSRRNAGHFGPANLVIGAHQFCYRASGNVKLGCYPIYNNYSGPPPAYEAALRATRLQSLTGSLPRLVDDDGKPIGDSLEWLSSQSQSQVPEKQLDFGDYFHQPKEDVYVPIEPTIAHPAMDRERISRPVLLRLWVKMMEPGELVARARKAKQAPLAENNRRPSLTRQLSIPHLFGSLVNLASGRMSTSNSETTSQIDVVVVGNEQKPDVPAINNEMLSLASTTSSGESTSSATANSAEEQAKLPSTDSQPNSESQKPERSATKPSKRERRLSQVRALASSGSITSRVLHMNVASFSYVKDESLISTKRHNQMNYQHFCSNGKDAVSLTKNPKLCQLMISVCDVENLLNSSWLNERPCALLASSSSVYVQCEILTSKGSKSARILRYPLEALNNNQGEASTHTLDFASTIPAAAVERPPIIPYGPVLLTGVNSNTATDCSLTGTEAGDTSTTSSSGQSEPSSIPRAAEKIISTNWRHEPSADGKSIVMFNSVPKQIAQTQQEVRGSAISDLIQFDSVFVSPILSKSIIEEGYVRFRFYSQCKYVNEFCLAELKLPLKQLMRSPTRDNLGDASGALQQHQQQAELILDNLLANLVTASNGSPLSALIEQISAEERECNGETEPEQATSPAFRLPWTQQQQQTNTTQTGQMVSSGEPSMSNFDEQPRRNPFDDDRESRERARELEAAQEHERRIERNYCRSLLVSHWLNYLAAPTYECQLAEEARGKLILGLTYLPTSNRVIFNAHRANIDDDSYSASSGQTGKQMIKSLRLQSSTCYLLRFLMVTNGRVVKRKQTPASRRPEWDSQEAITFDLVSVSVGQPHFIVALVIRNVSLGTGSLRDLRNQNCCSCGLSRASQSANKITTDGYTSQPEQRQRAAGGQAVHSDPESLSNPRHRQLGGFHETNCIFHRHNGGRDLVIGHLVLGEQIWREMKAQPRKQIVKQFKIY